MRVIGLVLVLALMPAALAQSQDAPPQASLLTFAPGQIYWQRFGHNALLLRYANGGTQVFNYGVFDFQQENFLLNFARGRMRYELAIEPLQANLAAYAAEGRWVWEQRLALSLQQRRQLQEYLLWNALPENAPYAYDYFRANCSTRVRDALDQVLGGALRAQLENRMSDLSYRQDVRGAMAPLPALQWGMDWLIGPAGDQPLNLWQKAYLPLELMEAVRDVQRLETDGRLAPLVLAEGWLYRAGEAPGIATAGRLAEGQSPFFFLSGTGLGLLLAGLALGAPRARLARIGFSMVAGILSLLTAIAGGLIVAAWLWSDHWIIADNFNALLATPLSLLLLPGLRDVAVARRPGAVRLAALILAMAALGASASLSGISAQQSANWVALWLPVHFSIALALYWLSRRPRPVAANAAAIRP